MHMKWFVSFMFLVLLEAYKAESEDVRVKLCGREFIRKVVTSCGSSRLRRDVPQSDLHFANPHWNLQNWMDIDGLVHQRGSLMLEDDRWQEQDVQDSMRGHAEPAQQPEVLEYSTTALDLSTSSRTRRDAGPAGICCTSGCTMSELIQYC